MTLSQLIETAAAESNSDFIIALKSYRRVLESLAQAQMQKNDQNAVIPIWKTIVEILNSEKGSQSIRRIATQIKDVMQDRTASQTMINFANMLYECFTYEPTKRSLRFPWKEFRSLIYSDSLRVIPLLYSGIWEIVLNGRTGEKFSQVINFLGDAFVQYENKHDLSKILNDEKINERMNAVLGESGEENSSGEITVERVPRHINDSDESADLAVREPAGSLKQDNAARWMYQNGGGNISEHMAPKSSGV